MAYTIHEMFKELPKDVVEKNILRWVANNELVLERALNQMDPKSEERDELLVLYALSVRLGEIWTTGSGK